MRPRFSESSWSVPARPCPWARSLELGAAPHSPDASQWSDEVACELLCFEDPSFEPLQAEHADVADAAHHAVLAGHELAPPVNDLDRAFSFDLA